MLAKIDLQMAEIPLLIFTYLVQLSDGVQDGHQITTVAHCCMSSYV